MPETWLSVMGAYGAAYDVSSMGRVRRKGKNRSLSCFPVKGYRAVNLSLQGLRKKRYVHQLVAEAFHATNAVGREVNHINLDKSDNRATNLEWLTRSGNMLHAVAKGAVAVGSAHKGAKLNEEIVSNLIEEFISCNQPVTEFSETRAPALGVIMHTVWAVLNRRTWKHVVCDEKALRYALDSRWHRDRREVTA